MSNYTMICCVLNMGDASKALRFARKYQVRGGTIHYGSGTVHHWLLDLLQVNESQKEILNMIIEDELASAAMKGISEDMQFHKHNHGIAFSYPVSAFIGSTNANSERKETIEEKKSMYKAIYTVVDKGKADEVIEAANSAGARGGTIIHARGAGIHEAQKLFGLEIEPEKEEVLVITKDDIADAVVQAIRIKLRIDEPGTGIIFVVDIQEVYGLRE